MESKFDKREKEEKKKTRKFSKLKNKIHKKHNLTVVEISDSEEDEIKEKSSIIQVELIHPYIKLLDEVKLILPRVTLNVYDDKNIEILYKKMSKKYERSRIKSLRKMNLLKNKLKVMYEPKKGYGIKKGIILLDDKEGEKVTVFKRYSAEIKNRFACLIKIYFQFYHDFNFTFSNKETKESFSFYYYDDIKPKMIVFSYKSKYGNKIEKYRIQLNIGEFLNLTLRNYEDNNGEHFCINFLNYSINFSHMLRIMDIESNCCFDVELECNDEILFDI